VENETITKTIDQQKLDIIKSYITFFRGNLEIEKRIRKRFIVQTRQEIFYFAKMHTNLTLEYIGQQVSGMDHSTVLYSYKTIKDKMLIYSAYKNELKNLELALELKYAQLTGLKEEKMNRLMQAADKYIEKNDTIELCIIRGDVKIVYHISSNYVNYPIKK
jgi:hypothetical protein